MALPLRLALLGLAASCASGCALIDSRIPVHATYGAAPQAASAQAVPLSLVVIPPASPRQGVKKNGYGSELASVYTEPEPRELIEGALAAHLARVGYRVAPEEATARVVVQVHRFFAEPEVGMFAGDVFAVLDATVFVVFDDGKAAKRRFKGIGMARALAWTDEVFRAAYEKCLQDFTAKTAPALREVFEAPPSPPLL